MNLDERYVVEFSYVPVGEKGEKQTDIALVGRYAVFRQTAFGSELLEENIQLEIELFGQFFQSYCFRSEKKDKQQLSPTLKMQGIQLL